MLVGARILQGIGGAMMVPVGRLVVLRATAKRDLLDATAYLTWPALLAPVLAPALGGWIVSVASWPWIFLINVPLGVLAFVVAGADRPSGEGAVGRPAGLGRIPALRRLPAVPAGRASSCVGAASAA